MPDVSYVTRISRMWPRVKIHDYVGQKVSPLPADLMYPFVRLKVGLAKF